MLQAECLKCGHVADQALPVCPKCGAIHAKVHAARAAADQAEAAARSTAAAKESAAAALQARVASERANASILRQHVCTVCHTVSTPGTRTPGSLMIELVLWIFIVPGLIYTLWRHSARGKVCRACGSTNIVPAKTPAGRKLLRDLGMLVDG